uniref:RWD domain-containing protein 1 n=1 Tax=Nannospalax galili TaxID=1026970 RepID=A0A8C6QSN1_NANGA
MDHRKEQRNELEALESIYPDSFTVLPENPPSFTITVTSEAGENDETVQTTVKFTYSKKYPDEAPLYEIVSQENLEDNDVSDILKLLALQTEENLGMVMIFSHSCIRQKLGEVGRRKETKRKKLFHGTPVTVENFLNWKAKFDQLFETGHNLDTSDIQFLEDAGNNVEVNESLFQEMDDLELGDDEDIQITILQGLPVAPAVLELTM